MEGIFALVGVVIGYFLCWIKIEKKEAKQKLEEVKKIIIKDTKKAQVTSPSKLLKQKELDDI